MLVTSAAPAACLPSSCVFVCVCVCNEEVTCKRWLVVTIDSVLQRRWLASLTRFFFVRSLGRSHFLDVSIDQSQFVAPLARLVVTAAASDRWRCSAHLVGRKKTTPIQVKRGRFRRDAYRAISVATSITTALVESVRRRRHQRNEGASIPCETTFVDSSTLYIDS